MTTPPRHTTGVRAISIPVNDQDAALRFYTGTLGFTVLRDNPTPNGGRWIELAPGQGNPVLTLEPAAPDITRGAIGIRFTTNDVEAAHAAPHHRRRRHRRHPPLARCARHVRLPRPRRQRLVHHRNRVAGPPAGRSPSGHPTPWSRRPATGLGPATATFRSDPGRARSPRLNGPVSCSGWLVATTTRPTRSDPASH